MNKKLQIKKFILDHNVDFFKDEYGEWWMNMCLFDMREFYYAVMISTGYFRRTKFDPESEANVIWDGPSVWINISAICRYLEFNAEEVIDYAKIVG